MSKKLYETILRGFQGLNHIIEFSKRIRKNFFIAQIPGIVLMKREKTLSKLIRAKTQNFHFNCWVNRVSGQKV